MIKITNDNITEDGVLAIPFGVKEIAFKGYYDDYEEKVRKIIVPSTVKRIGEKTFFCYPNLEEVVLSYGLIFIGKEAFADTPLLNKIILPESLVSIDEYAFFRSGLEYIEIPHSVEVLGDDCFSSCKKLKRVSFVDSQLTDKIRSQDFYSKYFLNSGAPHVEFEFLKKS